MTLTASQQQDSSLLYDLIAHTTTQAGFLRIRPVICFSQKDTILSLFKLLKEPQVILEEEAQIIDLILQHSDTFNTHTEGESCIFFWVYITGFQDVRVADAAAENLHPAGMFAYVTAFTSADVTGDIHLCGSLGEREI